MFDSEFYPTPSNVAHKMLLGFNLDEEVILEPSAGKGDILDIIQKTGYRKRRVFAIEHNIELQAILKSKGYPIIDTDFLEYEPDMDFSLIIMNPPFSNGDEHFLKAWEIMKNGTIVCLLNEETLKNPFSQKRKLIHKILDDNHGTVEYLGNCFSTSERKTGVNIAMVKVSKETKGTVFDFSNLSDKEYIQEEENKNTEVATVDMLENIVSDYQRAKEYFAEGMALIQRAQQISSSISDNYQCKPFEIAAQGGPLRDRLLTFTKEIKHGVWMNIAKRLKVERYMTKSVKDNFDKFIQEQGHLAVTKKNIQAFASLIMQNSGNILDECINEVFDLLTKYYKENREYVEGWKTNDRWKVNKKMILPNWVEINFDGRFAIPYTNRRKYEDIDKAMCYISGKKFDDIRTVENTLQESFHIGENLCESEFFKIRYFKKGTVHLEFLDEFLWKEFNMRACAGKNWLPQGEKKEWERNKKSIVPVMN